MVTSGEFLLGSNMKTQNPLFLKSCPLQWHLVLCPLGYWLSFDRMYNLRRWDRPMPAWPFWKKYRWQVPKYERIEIEGANLRITQSLRVTNLPVICVFHVLLAWFSLWYHKHLKLIWTSTFRYVKTRATSHLNHNANVQWSQSREHVTH